METSIDIIIPTLNRPESAAAVTRSCVPLLGPHDRIIVVWQGTMRPPIDESAAVRLIRSHPPNLPAARNRGIQAGTSDYVLFLDDDVEILTPDLLDRHRAVYAEQALAGAVAGGIEDEIFPKDAALVSTFDESTGALVQNFSLLESGPAISVMGAHMSFKRSALLAVGGFDEHFGGNALWEEIDCAFRLRCAGFLIWFCAQARVTHLRNSAGGCRGASSLRYIFDQFANTAYFAMRHAPKKHRAAWRTYWKYRLEFCARSTASPFRHSPVLLAGGLLGAAWGSLKHFLDATIRSPHLQKNTAAP